MSTESRRARAGEIIRKPSIAPLTLKHCILRKMHDPKIRGDTEREKFTSATDLCLWSLEQNDFVYKDTLRLTTKGYRRQNTRQRHPDTGKKNREFARIVRRLQREEEANG